MNANFAQKFMDDQIPVKIRRLFPPKLKLAYAAADEHIKAHPMLRIPSAAGHQGRVISLAVDFAVKGLIDSQEWPVEYRWEFYARPTGQYLQVVMPHSTLSISQVNYWHDQPRDVVFRSNDRLGNRQIELPGFEPEDNSDDEDVPGGRISFLLVHGHGTLEFAHIGIPHPQHARGYIYQTPNLMRLLYEVEPPDDT